jgi:hypothetical protein
MPLDNEMRNNIVNAVMHSIDHDAASTASHPDPYYGAPRYTSSAMPSHAMPYHPDYTSSEMHSSMSYPDGYHMDTDGAMIDGAKLMFQGGKAHAKNAKRAVSNGSKKVVKGALHGGQKAHNAFSHGGENLRKWADSHDHGAAPYAGIQPKPTESDFRPYRPTDSYPGHRFTDQAYRSYPSSTASHAYAASRQGPAYTDQAYRSYPSSTASRGYTASRQGPAYTDQAYRSYPSSTASYNGPRHTDAVYGRNMDSGYRPSTAGRLMPYR